MINDFKLNKSIIILIIISFFLFALKWILSFYYFPGEDISIKIINDSYEDSFLYFHYVKSLANFDFNNIYLTTSSESDLMPIPYGAILIHTIFFKVFGITSFIFLEFLSIFIFLFIFFSIFKKLEFNLEYSILLSLITYTSPLTASYFNYFEISEINTFVAHFYNLRFPRPLIANLFLFYFIYQLIVFNSESLIKLKTLIKLTLIMGLSLSSFYFLFLVEIISLFIIILIKVKKNISIVNIKNFLKLFYSICIFLIIVSPFIYLLINGSEAFSQRMGIVESSFLDKKFLIEHYFSKLLNYKLLIIYIFLTISFIFIKKSYKKDFEIVNIFYIIFISSILSPLLFIILSSKVAVLYHFNNIVVICTILLFGMIFLILSKHNIKKLFFNNKIYLFSFSFLILITYNIYSFNNFNKKIDNIYRHETNELFKIFSTKDIEVKNLSLLTFDTKIMTWAILNDIKDINVLDGLFSPRSNELTDISLIESLKFLNLEISDFKDFIKNKKVGYRYINDDARTIYWLKYQANSAATFKRSLDFNNDTLEHILNSSPFYSHQFAIPEFEEKRLLNLFLNHTGKNLKNPDLILINNKHHILRKSKINLNNYCIIYNKEFISAYLKKNLC